MMTHSTIRTGVYTAKYVRAAAAASMEPTAKKMTIPNRSPMPQRGAPRSKDEAASAEEPARRSPAWHQALYARNFTAPYSRITRTLPSGPSDPVQHVPAQPLGKVGTIEVASGITDHADPLHYPPRPVVVGHGERDDLCQFDVFEAEPEGGASRLGRVALSPVRGGQPPSDLDTGHERCVELRDRQADEPSERRHAVDVHRPQSEAVHLEVPCDALGACIALLGGHRRQVFRNPRIGIQRRERHTVGGHPPPQQEPIGAQLSRQFHVTR